MLSFNSTCLTRRIERFLFFYLVTHDDYQYTIQRTKIGFPTRCLVGVGKTTHTRHHAEHVVVGGIDIHGRRGRGADRVVGDREEERGVVNTRQVASTRRLVLFRLESKGVHVDTDRRDVGVVLVRLDFVEVATFTDLETIVAVELDERGDTRVLARHAFHASDGVTGLKYRAVPPIGEVEGLLTLPGEDDGIFAGNEGVALDNPDEFLTRVVEVELELVGGRSDGLTASELENIDEVLVGDLGELTTLISIEVDVVDVEGGSNQVGSSDTITDDVYVGVLGSSIKAQVADVIEGQVDTHFVVLEGDQRESKTRVAAEPELEGDVEGVFRSAVLDFVGRVGFTRGAVIIAGFTALDNQIGELGYVTNHLGITGLLTRLLGEFIPDVEPLTIMLIDTLTTDLEFNLADEVVARPVEPAELCTRAVRSEELYLGESGLEVHAVDQVTVALNSDSHLLTKARGTIERILNGLHGEVGVTTVYNLEESNLGVTCEVNILGAISDELHQTTTCHLSLYP